jgi:endonuclease V-like protein UPF0215 family
MWLVLHPSPYTWVCGKFHKKKTIEETRALAFEDGPFTSKGGTKKRRAPLIALLTEGFRISKIALAYLKVDGLEATDVMIDLANSLSGDEDVIFLHGAAYAGFNVVDVQQLLETIKSPIILVLRSKPNPEAVRQALMKHFIDWEKRLQILRRAGEIRSFEPYPNMPLFYEAVGIEASEAEALIRGFTIMGKIPEPLRIARIMAQALCCF